MTSTTQFNRYMWLVELLYSRGALTKEQIDHYWARSYYNEKKESTIPKRTFVRMKEAIAMLFDIEISFSKTRGYYISNREDISQDDIRSWRINTFAVSNILHESADLKGRILLEDIPSGNRFLTQVIDAMRQSKTIMVEYQNFQMSQPCEFEISPYCLKVFKQRWYILGPRTDSKDLHFYSLDRFCSLTITEHEFSVPKRFDAEEYFLGFYGIMRDNNKVERVRVQATAFRANYLRSLPLHNSQKEIERTADHSVFEYRVAPTADFIQELRAIGPDITILHPQWLRERMIEEAKQIINNYK